MTISVPCCIWTLAQSHLFWTGKLKRSKWSCSHLHLSHVQLYFPGCQKKTMFTCAAWSGWVVRPCEKQVDQNQLVEHRLNFWIGPFFPPSNAFTLQWHFKPCDRKWLIHSEHITFHCSFDGSALMACQDYGCFYPKASWQGQFEHRLFTSDCCDLDSRPKRCGRKQTNKAPTSHSCVESTELKHEHDSRFQKQ